MYISWSVMKDIIVALTATIGMALGIYNFFKERRKDKVRLKITPKSVMQIIDGERRHSLTNTGEFNPNRNAGLFGMDIVNMSQFPVTIKHAGFIRKGTDNRLTIVIPIIDDGKEWPRKLEPREAVSIYGNLHELIKSNSLHLIKSAYAETACGHVGKGTSGALKDLIEFGHKIRVTT
jgi:hypothetical protein